VSECFGVWVRGSVCVVRESPSTVGERAAAAAVFVVGSVGVPGARWARVRELAQHPPLRLRSLSSAAAFSHCRTTLLGCAAEFGSQVEKKDLQENQVCSARSFSWVLVTAASCLLQWQKSGAGCWMSPPPRRSFRRLV
jgi:hypothetical protein